MKDFDIYFIHTLSVSIADFSKLISAIFCALFVVYLYLMKDAMDARIQER